MAEESVPELEDLSIETSRTGKKKKKKGKNRTNQQQQQQQPQNNGQQQKPKNRKKYIAEYARCVGQLQRCNINVMKISEDKKERSRINI